MAERMPNVHDNITNHETFQEFNNTGILNILAVNKDGIIVYANKAELSFSGYTSEEYVGKSIDSFYPEESLQQKILESTETGKELYNVESTLKCKKGSVKNALISTRNLQDNSGLSYTYLFVRDISIYKKNENLLSYLNTAAEMLAGARDTEEALTRIAELIVP
ncbi:MAG: PAS domain-containing protein [Sphingobacteriaceae bacterium]|nr:PAS domain-containing protein [Sphingobacteriaceae bacterium]